MLNAKCTSTGWFSTEVVGLCPVPKQSKLLVTLGTLHVLAEDDGIVELPSEKLRQAEGNLPDPMGAKTESPVSVFGSITIGCGNSAGWLLDVSACPVL